MSNNFYVGQKVVCVDAAEPDCDGEPMVPLIEGHVYTVSGFAAPSWIDGSPCICLKEQANSSPGYIKDWGYRIYRFRPAVDPNIEQFRKLVEPKELEKVKRKLVDA